MNATQSRPNRPLVWIVASLLLAVAGCIAIPLGDPEKSKVDPKLVGAWMTKPQDNGDQTMFTVTAYDARTYFVSEFDFSKGKDKPDVKPNSRMDWKMWLTDVGGQQFATLEMIDPQLLVSSSGDDNKEKYAIANLKLDGDKIHIQTVNDDFIKSANVQDSQQLQDFIAKNLDNPKLFANGDGTADEGVDVTRVTDAQTDDAGAVLSAFGDGSKLK